MDEVWQTEVVPLLQADAALSGVTLLEELQRRHPGPYNRARARYGKVGNSGVRIATLDDMKALYAGFDLTNPATSVSMTINGPAPTILAMFMNTAIDQ